MTSSTRRNAWTPRPGLGRGGAPTLRRNGQRPWTCAAPNTPRIGSTPSSNHHRRSSPPSALSTHAGSTQTPSSVWTITSCTVLGRETPRPSPNVLWHCEPNHQLAVTTIARRACRAQAQSAASVPPVCLPRAFVGGAACHHARHPRPHQARLPPTSAGAANRAEECQRTPARCSCSAHAQARPSLRDGDAPARRHHQERRLATNLVLPPTTTSAVKITMSPTS